MQQQQNKNNSSNSNSSSSSSSSSNSNSSNINSSSSTSTQQQSALPGFRLAFSLPPSGQAEPRLDWDRIADTVFMDEIGKMSGQCKQPEIVPTLPGL